MQELPNIPPQTSSWDETLGGPPTRRGSVSGSGLGLEPTSLHVEPDHDGGSGTQKRLPDRASDAMPERNHSRGGEGARRLAERGLFCIRRTFCSRVFQENSPSF